MATTKRNEFIKNDIISFSFTVSVALLSPSRVDLNSSQRRTVVIIANADINRQNGRKKWTSFRTPMLFVFFGFLVSSLLRLVHCYVHIQYICVLLHHDIIIFCQFPFALHFHSRLCFVWISHLLQSKRYRLHYFMPFARIIEAKHMFSYECWWLTGHIHRVPNIASLHTEVHWI